MSRRPADGDPLRLLHSFPQRPGEVQTRFQRVRLGRTQDRRAADPPAAQLPHHSCSRARASEVLVRAFQSEPGCRGHRPTYRDRSSRPDIPAGACRHRRWRAALTTACFPSPTARVRSRDQVARRRRPAHAPAIRLAAGPSSQNAPSPRLAGGMGRVLPEIPALTVHARCASRSLKEPEAGNNR